MSVPSSVPPFEAPVRGRVVGLVLGLTVLAVVAVPAAGLWMYANHDRIDFLDLPVVDETAAHACAELATALQAAGRPGSDRVQAIEAGNAAIGQLVETVEALGHDTLARDRPAEDWIADWQALVAARRDLQGEINRGAEGPRLEVPMTDDGYPITMRMTVAAGGCEAAIGLAANP